jgi:mxaA protein
VKRAVGRRLSIATGVAISAAISAASAQDGASGDGGSTAKTYAVVEQPRPFGYVIGDLVTQRILLHAERREFEPAALSKPQRLGAWLERRPARVETTAKGERWLVVEYQIVNAPQALTTVSLPAWSLSSADRRRELSIAAWPISVAPLTPSGFATAGPEELRADRPAPAVATAPLRQRLGFWSGAFVATLAAWLSWLLWRNWRASSSLPFARAWGELRHLDETAPEAWQSLHRAFDATAGRVVQTKTLSVLFQRAPHLKRCSPAIEQFFAQSAQRFFGAGPPADPISVRALCSELRRMEKRCER